MPSVVGIALLVVGVVLIVFGMNSASVGLAFIRVVYGCAERPDHLAPPAWHRRRDCRAPVCCSPDGAEPCRKTSSLWLP